MKRLSGVIFGIAAVVILLLGIGIAAGSVEASSTEAYIKVEDSGWLYLYHYTPNCAVTVNLPSLSYSTTITTSDGGIGYLHYSTVGDLSRDDVVSTSGCGADKSVTIPRLDVITVDQDDLTVAGSVVPNTTSPTLYVMAYGAYDGTLLEYDYAYPSSNSLGLWSVDFSATLEAITTVKATYNDADGDEYMVEWNIPQIHAKLGSSEVDLVEFIPNSPVTVSIPASGINKTVTVDAEGAGSVDLGMDVTVGTTVTAADAKTEKSLTMVDMGVTSVNQDTYVVSGYALPNQRVNIIAQEFESTSAVTYTIAEASGLWSIDLSSYAPSKFTTLREISISMHDPDVDYYHASWDGTPAAPVLTSPEDDTTLLDATPVFSWTGVDFGTGYQVEITDIDSGNVVLSKLHDGGLCSAGLPHTCTMVPEEPLLSGNYEWRVAAYNDAAMGAWSEKWAFTIETIYSPPVRFPKNGYEITAGVTTLKWTAVNHAFTYIIELYRPNGDLFDLWALEEGSVCDAGLCEFKLPVVLDTEYGSWQWRIKGQREDLDGVWSPQAEFNYTQVTRPVLTYPVNDMNVISSTTTLEWEDQGQNLYKYVIELRKMDGTLLATETFTPSVYCTDGVCSWPTETLPDGSYKWRVLGKKWPNMTLWTSMGYFNILTHLQFTSDETLLGEAAAISSAPAARFPKNGYEITVGTTQFKWGLVSGAAEYELELFRPNGDSFDTWVLTDDVCDETVCTFKPSYKLDTEYGEWQWRVRGRDGVTAGPWSDKAAFVYAGLDLLVQLSPVDGVEVESTTPTFTWEDSAQNVYKYVIEIWTMDGSRVTAQSLNPGDVCSGGTCSWTSTTPFAAGEYKWHVLCKKWPNNSGWTGMEVFHIVE